MKEKVPFLFVVRAGYLLCLEILATEDRIASYWENCSDANILFLVLWLQGEP